MAQDLFVLVRMKIVIQNFLNHSYIHLFCTVDTKCVMSMIKLNALKNIVCSLVFPDVPNRDGFLSSVQSRETSLQLTWCDLWAQPLDL